MHITDLYVYTDTFHTSSNRPAVVVRTYPKSFRPYTIWARVCCGVLAAWCEWKSRDRAEYFTKSFREDFRSGFLILFFCFRGRRSQLHRGLYTLYYTYRRANDLTIGMRRICYVLYKYYVYTTGWYFLSWDLDCIIISIYPTRYDVTWSESSTDYYITYIIEVALGIYETQCEIICKNNSAVFE